MIIEELLKHPNYKELTVEELKLFKIHVHHSVTQEKALELLQGKILDYKSRSRTVPIVVL